MPKDILEEKVELIDIVAESKNDLHEAALNSIYFDIKTRATDGRIYTIRPSRTIFKGQYTMPVEKLLYKRQI